VIDNKDSAATDARNVPDLPWIPGWAGNLEVSRMGISFERM
jgi:hypothetical protein